MNEKFKKYWKMSSASLAVACFLDPRWKKKVVEYHMKKFHGNEYQVHLDKFVSLIKKLYQFYATTAPALALPPSVKGNAYDAIRSPTEDLFAPTHDAELDSFLYDDISGPDPDLNELERYMSSPLLKQNEFHILAWRKKQTQNFLSFTNCS